VSRSSLARRLAASTAAALVLSSLSGCFLLPSLNPESPTEHTSAAPTQEALDGGTGSCWDTNFDDMAAWASWEGSDPVSCDEFHQSYTFLANDLEAEVAEPFDGDGMTGELAFAISEQCRVELEDEYDITDKEKRIGFFFFAPTEAEWNDGSRAIRCDIGVYGFGSDYLNGVIELEDLPADIHDLLDDVESNGVTYQLCLTGDGVGPYEGTTMIVDCNDDYFWRYGGLVEYPGTTETDPYPEGNILYDYAIDKCPLEGIAGAETVYPYVPTQETWEQYGDRNIECWFSTLNEPSTTA
jgi:hypothetical protein